MLWVFDMDDTLYTPASLLEQAIRRRVVTLLSELTGLHGDELTRYVYTLLERHQTDFAVVAYSLETGMNYDELLQQLYPFVDLRRLPLVLRPGVFAALNAPGETCVLTNAPTRYARHLLRHLRLFDQIDTVYGSGPEMRVKKPASIAYDRIQYDGPVVMIDNKHKNLIIPKERGWTTVWFPTFSHEGSLPPHVDHCLTDLTSLPNLISG